jgi:hypothetical protein
MVVVSPIGMPPSAWRVLFRAHGNGPHSRKRKPAGRPFFVTEEGQQLHAIDEYRWIHSVSAFEILPRSWKDCLELHSKAFVENVDHYTTSTIRPIHATIRRHTTFNHSIQEKL